MDDARHSIYQRVKLSVLLLLPLFGIIFYQCGGGDTATENSGETATENSEDKCSSAFDERAPEWVLQPFVIDQTGAQLYFVGEGNTQGEALASAYERYAAFLQTRVESSFTECTLENSEQYKQSIESNLQVSVAENIQGAAIFKTYDDPCTDRFYVQIITSGCDAKRTLVTSMQPVLAESASSQTVLSYIQQEDYARAEYEGKEIPKKKAEINEEEVENARNILRDRIEPVSKILTPEDGWNYWREHPEDRFIVHGNGTVTDQKTGLIWQQDTEDETYTWEEAMDYCEDMVLAGHDDWRLPTIKELRTLVDYSRYSPAIDVDAFPSCQSGNYWSSTTYALDTSNAWYVYFDNGYDYTLSKTGSYYVRCVH